MRFLKSNWLIVLTVILLGFLATVTWKSQSLNPFTSPSPEPQPPRFDRLHVTDLQYTTTVSGHEVILNVQEITHAKRTIGPLTVNPLKELTLKEVNLRLHLDNIESNSVLASPSAPTRKHMEVPAPSHPPMEIVSLLNSLPKIFQDMFRAKDLGFISRVQIHGFKIHISQNDHSNFSLIANKVDLGLSKSAIIFTKGFSLETPTHQKLVANKAEWQPQSQRLFIPGTFVIKGHKEFAGTKGFFTLSSSGTLQGPLPSPS